MKNRELIKQAKANFNKSKQNTVKFLQDKNELVSQLVKSTVPNWGGIKISLSK